MAKGELTDAEVLQPPAQGELSDADVMTGPSLREQTFFSPEFAKQYAAKGLEEFQRAPGFTLGGLRFAAGALGSIPGSIVDGVADLFTKSHKAWNEGLTPQEETEFATNAMLTQIGAEERFRLPKTKTLTPAEEFHEQVAKPIAQSVVDSTAPPRITVPLDPRNVLPTVETFQTVSGQNVANVSMPGAGDFRFDLQRVGDNDRGIDLVVQTTGGRTGQGLTAYTALADHLAQQGQKLYIEKTEVSPAAQRIHQGLDEAGLLDSDEQGSFVKTLPPPEVAASPEAAANNLQQLVNDVKEARDLGVVGGDREPIPDEETPAVAAQRAIPARAKQGDKITMTPAGESIDAYQKRFAEWVSKIKHPGDIDGIIMRAAEENNFFPQARAGEIPAAHIEELAKASGFDSTKFDRDALRTRFQSDDEFRAMMQAQLQTRDDYRAALQKATADPSVDNINAAMDAKARHENALEYVAAFRSDWGKAGLAQQEFLRSERRRAQYIERDRSGVTREPNDLVAATESFADKPSTAGLNELIEAAEKTVRAAEKPTATPLPGVNDLVESARNVLKRLAPNREATTALDRLIAAAEAEVAPATGPQRTIGEPAPQGLPQMLGEAKAAVKRIPGGQKLISLIEEAERTAMTTQKVEMPGQPAVMPKELSDLVAEARKAASRLRNQNDQTPRPLLQLLAAADRAAGPRKTAVQRSVAQQLPPELQALVDKAERVTKRFGGIDRDAAEIRAATEATEGLDKEGFSYVVGKAWDLAKTAADKTDRLFWLRNNWLLSGPITHTFYFAVNTGTALAEHVLNPAVAAVIDRVGGGRNAFFGEPFAGLMGLAHAVPGASKAAWTAAKTGLRVPLESELRLAERGEESPQARGANIPYLAHSSPDWGAISAAADWLGVPMAARRAAELAAGGWAGRFANLQHTFFKVLNEGAQAHQNAYVATAKEGLNPLSDANFADRYVYHLKNPTDDVLRDNVNAGYAGTFMQKLGPKTQRLTSALKDTPLRWEFPFLHVPVNIARMGVSYSPLAVFGSDMRAQLMGKQGARPQALALARVFIGTAVMSYIYSLAMQEEVTGDYPTDKKEQDRWKALNIQPNSFKWGNQWKSYSRFGPVRIPMTIGANLADIVKHYDVHDDEAMAKAGGKFLLSTVDALGDEVGMLSLRQFLDAHSGQKKLSEYAASTLGSFMPYSTLLNQLASYNDPSMRQVRGFTDEIKYKWPWTRQSLPPKRDALFGEPLPNPAYQAFIRTSPVNPDPIKAELDRIGYHPAAPHPEIGKVKLTPEQYDRYEATAGPYVRKELTEAIQSPLWAAHNNQPEWQEAVAKGRIERARARARGVMQADSMARDGADNLVAAGRRRRMMQINGN